VKVTIVGGGFGGVKAALELAEHPNNHVTLISDKPDFQYYPALFATATGHSHRQSWIPLETIFDDWPNVELITEEKVNLHPDTRQLVGKQGTYDYKTLILALGSVTTYFGIEGLDTFSYGIKSQDEIRRLQNHLFEEMRDGSDDEKNYVIIGGGATGVELAGALGEYLLVLRRHFGIRKKRLRITLVEAAPRLLPRLSESTSRKAAARLKRLGVHVETDKKVERQTAESLMVSGRPLSTQTVIWTSGVTNAPFFNNNSEHFTINERGKVVVDEFMRARTGIYVIGDNAATPYAGLAQTALHDAQFVVRHLNGSKKTYRPVQPASVIPIGHHWAVFEWGRLRFAGWLGGFMRMSADLIGYHDVLPIGWAVKAWRSQDKQELRIPDEPAILEEG